MKTNVRFETRSGYTLAGVLHRPDAGTPRAYALFAHCFTCTKNLKAAVNIADALVQEGLAVLRFDFTGLGQSEGEFAATHFSSNVEDLLDAARFLAEEYEAPALLVGHSLGGTACLVAAGQLESVQAVATLGSPADAAHILGLLEDDIDAIEQKGEAQVRLDGRSFTLRKDFVDDVRAQRVAESVRSLRKALLVMHSPLDQVVSIEEATRIYTSAKHPKSFVSLDDADHLLSRERDSRYAGQLIAAWASRYLAASAAPLPAAVFVADATVVTGRPEDMFRVSMNAKGHALQADEPESYGGLNSAPSPYDYLAAALGSCSVMTMNMYARRKKIPLEQAAVRIRHDKIHAEDCADCDQTTSKIDRFQREITLTGDLTPEQRKRLLEIADRCPVHRTLHSEIRIDSRLME